MTDLAEIRTLPSLPMKNSALFPRAAAAVGAALYCRHARGQRQEPASQVTRHRVKLVVDEWGSRFKPRPELDNSHLLGQQSTMRDAVLAGLTLDTFHRHADKVAMGNIAQLANCLRSLFFAHEDKFALTPTYQVFDMYSAHQGGTPLRTLVSSPAAGDEEGLRKVSLPGLSPSASWRGRELTLTLSNLAVQARFRPPLAASQVVRRPPSRRPGSSSCGKMAGIITATSTTARISTSIPSTSMPRSPT